MTGAIKKISDPGGFIGGLTGEGSLEAAKLQADANESASLLQQAGVKDARDDILKLFPSSEGNLQLGFQNALDIFGQSLPAQTGAFQQGNVNAQQQLLAGLPQIQAALLGGNVDFSGLQPSKIDTSNLGFFQQQLPQFTGIEQVLQGNQQAQQAQATPNIFDFRGFNRDRSSPNISLGGINNLGNFQRSR